MRQSVQIVNTYNTNQRMKDYDTRWISVSSCTKSITKDRYTFCYEKQNKSEDYYRVLFNRFSQRRTPFIIHNLRSQSFRFADRTHILHN